MCSCLTDKYQTAKVRKLKKSWNSSAAHLNVWRTILFYLFFISYNSVKEYLNQAVDPWKIKLTLEWQLLLGTLLKYLLSCLLSEKCCSSFIHTVDGFNGFWAIFTQTTTQIQLFPQSTFIWGNMEANAGSTDKHLLRVH